jgi:endo-1,4-beta-xylanase
VGDGAPTGTARGALPDGIGGFLALALALAVLGACGGGGGDSPAAPSTPTPVPTADAEPLRDAAAASGTWVGAAVSSDLLRQEPLYAATFARHFDYVTAEWEMKWDPIQRQPGVYDFSGGDRIVGFAEEHGMNVKGHTLVWHGATPRWVDELSPPELRIAFEDHIRTVAGHYRGRVAVWDVVNEAIDDTTGGLRDTVFLRALGPGYVAEAFRLAREADPDALLVYNDYGGEGLSRKSDAIYDLVRGLKADGVPIDGVGLQMHISAAGYPPAADIEANVARLADLGLLVNISEMDVRIGTLAGDMAAKLERQREVYREVVGVCVSHPRCHAVTFWGFTDAHSWIDSEGDDPLLFDEQYQPKPAFFGVQDAYLGR